MLTWETTVQTTVQYLPSSCIHPPRYQISMIGLAIPYVSYHLYSAELSSLKVIRQSDLITIERLEREIEVLKTMKGDESNMESELSVLRTVLEDIQAQNK